MQKNKGCAGRRFYLVSIGIMLVIVLLVGMNGCKGSEKNEFCILSTTEDGDTVVIETTYGLLKYPYAFSDLIRVDAIDAGDVDQLRFSMDMEGEKVPLYTIYYNSDQGMQFGSLKLPNESNRTISVSVGFEKMPEGLSNDWQLTFQATLETFNDVLFSMDEDLNFSMTE